MRNISIENNLKYSKNFIGKRVIRLHQYLNTIIGSDVVIQGSYNTLNIGDLAIGHSIKEQLEENYIKCHINGNIRNKNNKFNNYDYHIIGGGGVLRDYPNGYLEPRLNPINTSKEGSIIFGVGVDGIFNVNKNIKLLKKINQCKLVTVRDEASKKILEKILEIDVKVRSCPAFLIDSKNRKNMIGKIDKSIGINLRNIPNSKWFDYVYFPEKVSVDDWGAWYIKFIKKELMPWVDEKYSQGYQFYFIPFCWEDLVFAKNYLKNSKIKILKLQSPKKTLDIVKKMNYMICTRYHSIIFSIISKIPFFALSYHNKTYNLLKNIECAKYKDFLFNKKQNIEFTDPINVIKANKLHINSAKEGFRDVFKIIKK